MTIYFAPIARLLGDLVVSFPPLQKLINDNDVCLVLRSPAQEGLAQRIPGLGGSINESEFLKLALPDESKFYNLRAHKLQTDFLWGSAEFYLKYPNYGIADVIKDICDDFGISHGQEELLPLHSIPRNDCVNKVLLIPGTAAPFKRWPNRSWMQLYVILKSMGVAVVMIGEPRYNSQISELMHLGMPWVATPLLSDALDAVSSARAVVSVDTGLMHLSVHQGQNTIALFRQNTMFLREYPHVRYLVASECQRECREKEFDFCPNGKTLFQDFASDKIFEYWSNLRCTQGNDSICMSAIAVESVIQAMLDRKML